MSATTLAPTLVRRSGLVAEATMVLSGLALLAVSAYVVIPLWFTPVPLTGQTFAVLLVGGALGATRGLLTVALYLAIGALGAPVFAEGASGLSGPTAGYLVGMLVAAWLVGRAAERGWDRRLVPCVLAMLAGHVAIYLFGLTWLAMTLKTGLWDTLALGAAPFVLGDLLKVALAAGLLPSAWAVVRRVRD
ncbi:MAG TPA: biotin transporter BioY [Micromonospora sp.]